MQGFTGLKVEKFTLPKTGILSFTVKTSTFTSIPVEFLKSRQAILFLNTTSTFAFGMFFNHGNGTFGLNDSLKFWTRIQPNGDFQ